MTIDQAVLDDWAREDLVMTPMAQGDSMVVRMERCRMEEVDFTLTQHVAGGPYHGIFINKTVRESATLARPQVTAGMTAYLTDEDAEDPDEYYLEKRIFRFWFRSECDPASQVATANQFFQEICEPEEFPRDYVNFIKRVILLVRKYIMIRKIDLEIFQVTDANDTTIDLSGAETNMVLPQQEVLVATTMMNESASSTLSTEGGRRGKKVGRGPSFKKLARGPSMKEKKIPSKRGRILMWIAKKQKILNILEDAYPNPMVVEDLIRVGGFQPTELMAVAVLLKDLADKGLIAEMEQGRWMRIPKGIVDGEGVEHEVQVVKNIPLLSRNEQPTIAIVTLLYCEKLAVDAMMDRKKTFVRYKTEGESQVYTVGMIGPHKVVSTKLARTGSHRGAMISAGNVITRLLGSFGQVEYVILVGVGGGVPDFTNYSNHVRLGDVVISQPPSTREPVYLYCKTEDRGTTFETRGYTPRDTILYNLIDKIRIKHDKSDANKRPWETYMDDGKGVLDVEETRFRRPPSKTDKLYKMEDNRLIQVEHPEAPDSVDGEPVFNLHYGTIGCGSSVVRRDDIRHDFAQANGIKAYDADFQAVMDSIEGNRKDNFVVIRGIADYHDGMRKKDWQPYAALAAAAYMKALVLAFPYEVPLTP